MVTLLLSLLSMDSLTWYWLRKCFFKKATLQFWGRLLFKKQKLTVNIREFRLSLLDISNSNMAAQTVLSMVFKAWHHFCPVHSSGLKSYHDLPGSRCTSHADHLGASCLPCHCLTFFWYFHLKLFLQLFQETTSYDQRLLRAGNQEKSFKNHLDSPFLPAPPSLSLWICISPTPPASFPSLLLLFCFVIETWFFLPDDDYRCAPPWLSLFFFFF